MAPDAVLDDAFKAINAGNAQLAAKIAAPELTKNPISGRAALLLLTLQYHQCEFDRSISLLRQLCSAPDLPKSIYHYAGVLAEATDELVLAADYFERAFGPQDQMVQRIRYSQTVIDHFVRSRDKLGPADIVLSIAVWGREYIERAAKYALASLLAPRNLAALAEGRRPLLFIFTTPDRHDILVDLHVIRKIGEICNIMIVHCPPELIYNKYLGLAMGISLGLHLARQLNADHCILFPDSIVADGSLSMLARLSDGYDVDALVATAMTADEAAVAPRVDTFRRVDGALAIDPGTLMDIGIQALHPLTRSAVINDGGPAGMVMPTELGHLWAWEPGALTVRHLQPLPYWISRRIWAASPRLNWSTPDNGLLDRLFPTAEALRRVRFLPDTSEFAFLGLANRGDQGSSRRFDTSELAARTFVAEASSKLFLTPGRVATFNHPCRMLSRYAKNSSEHDPEAFWRMMTAAMAATGTQIFQSIPAKFYLEENETS